MSEGSQRSSDRVRLSKSVLLRRLQSVHLRHRPGHARRPDVGEQQAAVQGAVALQPGERTLEATTRPGEHAERAGVERGDATGRHADDIRWYRCTLRRDLQQSVVRLQRERWHDEDSTGDGRPT